MFASSGHKKIHRNVGWCRTLLLAVTFGIHVHVATSHLNSFYVSMIRSPESTIAPQGDEVVFECQLNLVPERSEWRFLPSNYDPGSRDYIYLNNTSSEDGTSKLRLNVNSDTLGEYRCIAWFGASALASVPAQLTLAAIKLKDNEYEVAGQRGIVQEQVLRWSVHPDNTVLMRFGGVVSSPAPVWRFYKNGKPIYQAENTLPSDALIVNAVKYQDSGFYHCTAVNTITSTELEIPRKIKLTVEEMPQRAPYFLVEPPKMYSVPPGKDIVLECPGVGNPPPKAVWSTPDFNLSLDRMTQLDYGLKIVSIHPEDEGRYVCRLDNGIAPVIIHTIRLEVTPRLNAIVPPDIVKGPQATLTNESDSLELECVAKGSPKPEIYWMINGEETKWDPHIKHDGNKLLIKSVEKKHAGIVQCFAKNVAGEVAESNLLQVNPKQIRGELGSQPLGQVPTKTTSDHNGKQNKGRKKHKTPNMVPPSRPNVTRLSDDSVMIRWYVPKNEGLPIQFFKVQYRMLGNPAKKIPSETWQTTNDDIPYGKRDKNSDGYKNFTSSVRGLKPDRYYRFRIIAVYSNNDNKEGNTSGKFLLQRASQLGLSKGHLPAPALVKVEGVSDSAIILHWTLASDENNPIDGFYAHYRPSSTAGDYFKATVDSPDARQFQIDMLEPDTAYEFKLQSFTSSTASEFSLILTGKTLKVVVSPPVVVPSVIPASESSQDSNSMLPVIAGAALGGIFLVGLSVVLCFCLRRKKMQRDEENKEHIQADNTHFVSSHVISSQNHKGPHRLNGVVPRMNITPNPLAQEGDKNRNVMELRFIPPAGSLNQTPTLPVSVAQEQTPPQNAQQFHHMNQQYQKPYYHQNQPQVPLTATPTCSTSPSPSTQTRQLPPLPQSQSHMMQNHQSMNHVQAPFLNQNRRTLERSNANLHYSPDCTDGMTVRTPSLRRSRRSSGSTANGRGGGESNVEYITNSPRIQRSPIPSRAVVAAAVAKRNRLGSHTENMSSGSLNSIEV